MTLRSSIEERERIAKVPDLQLDLFLRKSDVLCGERAFCLVERDAPDEDPGIRPPARNYRHCPESMMRAALRATLPGLNPTKVS